MLLCQFDPHDEKCDPLEITNDETGPIDYKILLRALEGVAEQDPTPRSLIDWLAVARIRRLRHHSWAGRYVQAAQALNATEEAEANKALQASHEPEVFCRGDDQGEREDRAQEGQTTDTPSGAAMHQAPRNTVQANPSIGVSKKEIIAVFDPPNPRQTEKQWANMLGDPPEWLKPARVDSGGKGIQSLWNPAQLAICLAEKGAMQRRPLGAIIRRHFLEYLREWQDYAGTFD